MFQVISPRINLRKIYSRIIVVDSNIGLYKLQLIQEESRNKLNEVDLPRISLWLKYILDKQILRTIRKEFLNKIYKRVEISNYSFGLFIEDSSVERFCQAFF